MTPYLAEDEVEEACLDYFRDLGWIVLHGPDIGPGESHAERPSYHEPLLEARVAHAISALNPGLSSSERDEVLATVKRPESKDVMAENFRIHELLVKGVPIERRLASGEPRHDLARLIDFEHPESNDFVVVNQFSVEGDLETRRPDVVVFVNGIPLAVIEIKKPGEVRVTLRGAYDQLRTYAVDIPALLAYSAVSVVANGTRARMGALGSAFEHYAPWKTVDGTALAPACTPEMETLVRGVFEHRRFVDLVSNFVVFSQEKTLVKRVAKYHQFHAVNKAVTTTLEAIERGDGRAGVVWHTQGSGKSLEMLFYVGKLMRHPAMVNPTVVLLTDRNDLDDQLFDEVFAPARTLSDAPVQARGRDHLREILSSRASGGIVFSTMQKFGRTKEERNAARPFPCLSERSNVVVVADEAHRTQYDLIDGLARNLRDALPNAAFIGFTGTPVEASDHDTRAIFGDYIDIYDLTQAVEDDATVQVFYEARLAKAELPEAVRSQLDRDFDEVTELAEADTKEHLKSRWARVEAIVGADERLSQVAADIVEHWKARRDAMVGKALVVCMSRRICVDLYDKIVALQPSWRGDTDEEGLVKVVITGSASDGPELNAHVRSKERLRKLKERAKDPDDSLELVIVRDMWLTGFDSPPLHTMYVDKSMRGVGLMQAIARVNRTFRDKSGGLVVDYIGIADNLREALSDYTERDRSHREVGVPVDEVVAVLEEHCEVLAELLWGCPWREALDSGSPHARIEALVTAVDHLLTPREDGDYAERFLSRTRRAAQAFALVVTSPDALALSGDLAFYQAVATELRTRRADERGDRGDHVELETAIRQMVSDAVSAAGVVDIYEAAGLEKPDLSIIDDEFAKRFTTNPHPSLQIELLRRILSAEVRITSRRNVVSGRRFSEMLERAMTAYNNRTLTAAQVVEELVTLAKAIKEEHERGERLGLGADELAFYDAVYQNESAVRVLGDDTLKAIAQELVALVRKNATVDWDKKEQVRANMRRLIKRLLRKYDYPPDHQETAVVLVMEQAEAIAAEDA